MTMIPGSVTLEDPAIRGTCLADELIDHADAASWQATEVVGDPSRLSPVMKLGGGPGHVQGNLGVLPSKLVGKIGFF